MIVVEGKLDYRRMDCLSANTCVLFTGNSTIKRDGALVMGRGAAKEVRDAYPGIDHVLGDLIDKRANDAGRYGLVWIKGPGYIRTQLDLRPIVNEPIPESVSLVYLPRTIGCFQVKHHFKDNADITLIEYSAFMLGERARRCPELGFRMNYPGIGWGHLTEQMVEPILRRHLPDNVVLHK